MSNTRHVPPGLANGTPVPPSADVAQEHLANVIGQAVAVHLAKLLAGWQPQQVACSFCTVQRRQAEQAYATALANAQAAAEEPPGPPELPGIAQAVTWQPVQVAQGTPPVAVPVCYPHVQAGPAQRATGLVTADGRPIVAQA